MIINNNKLNMNEEDLYKQYIDDFRKRSDKTPKQKHIILALLKELHIGII